MMANRSPEPAIIARDEVFYGLSGLLLISAIALRWAGLPFVSHDVQDYLLYWMDMVIKHGRVAALSVDFNLYSPVYNYTPLYLYLMIAVSYLDGIFDRVTLIKLIPIPFDFVAAFLVYHIVFLIRADRRWAILAALIFLNLPTVMLDGSLWGQFDIIYGAFILAFVYFLICGRPYLAMLAYGLAITVKFQAIFLAPLFVYLLLTGVMPWAAILVAPLPYLAVSLPAAIAGHGWVELLTIYTRQVGFMHSLSARAPNFYQFFQIYLSEEQRSIATYAGVLLAGVVSLAVLATHFRRRKPLTPIFIIAATALWLGLEPSLLPRMHERYFLPADLVAFLFACIVPRAWWVAALFQVGSGLAYATYLATSFPGNIDTTLWAYAGALAMVAAIAGLLVYYLRLSRNEALA